MLKSGVKFDFLSWKNCQKFSKKLKNFFSNYTSKIFYYFKDILFNFSYLLLSQSVKSSPTVDITRHFILRPCPIYFRTCFCLILPKYRLMKSLISSENVSLKLFYNLSIGIEIFHLDKNNCNFKI